jgi:ComEC/Rec2-related protein
MAWALAWGAVGWTGGLVLGYLGPVPWAAALLVVGGALSLGLLLFLLRRPWTPALVLGAAGLGLLRMAFFSPPPGLPPGFAGAVVEGVFTAGPPEQIGGMWRFTATVHRAAEGPLREGHRVRVLLTTPPHGGEGRWPPVQRGDRLYLTGALRPLPEGGVGGALAREGIVGVLRPTRAALVEAGGKGLLGGIDRLRWHLALALRRSLPQPEAGLAQALLLGIRGDLLPEEWEAFRRAGTAHLLAVSGLHVALVLGLLEALVIPLVGHRRWGRAIPLVGVWGYALLAGMGPPVVRAALMGSLAALARLLGRPEAPLAALAVAAGVMAGVSPSLLGQASFQLSVAGMAGLAAFGPRLHGLLRKVSGRWEEGRPWLGALTGSLAFSMGASLGAVPLAALTFERLPLLGVIGTVLSLPFLLPALVLSGAAALAGAAWEPLGGVVGWPAWAALGAVRLFSVWLGGVTWASPTVQGAGVWVWGVYALLGLLWGWPFLRETIPRWVGGRPLPFPWAFPLLAGAAALAWGAALQVPPQRLTLVAFADGSWVLVGPQGQAAVVAAGPDPRPLLRALGKGLPFWERRVGLLVVATPAGVEAARDVLRRYRADAVVTPSGEEIAGALPFREGIAVHLGGGVWVIGEEGGRTPVFRVVWGQVAWVVGGSPWEGGGETVRVYRVWGPGGPVVVARVAGEEHTTPPGGALSLTAQQGRLWVYTGPGVP